VNQQEDSHDGSKPRPHDLAIDVRKLGKVYGPKTVIRGIDMTVERGQLIGLVGPNGAGKSTLLRTLIGLIQRTSGELRVLGKDPASESLAIRRRACYLPGETGVYSQMSGQQFLDFALGFYTSSNNQGCQRDLQEHLLSHFDLPLRQRIRSYSAGMKQKLAIVATLVPDVDLYLLDEPDRALDASVRYFLRNVLRSMKQAGKTILLSSHHLSEVETLADRLEFLLDGRLVEEQRLETARAQLRRWPRIRLRDPSQLPATIKVIRQDPDGMIMVAAEGDPMQWLRSLPEGLVDSAEIGIERLEDLYQLLLKDDPSSDSAIERSQS
jgi:ABC-2 type transport system ATP-binding protein